MVLYKNNLVNYLINKLYLTELHTNENKTNIKIDGIPQAATKITVIKFIGIITLSGKANLLYA